MEGSISVSYTHLPILHQRHEQSRRNVEFARKETELFLLDFARRVDRFKASSFPPSWMVMDKAFTDFDEGTISINALSVRILGETSPLWMKENTPHLYHLALIDQNSVCLLYTSSTKPSWWRASRRSSAGPSGATKKTPP